MLDAPAAAQGPQDAEHQPMDVEERQRVGEPIVGGPRPHLGEGIEVGDDRPPRDDGALGRPGRPRGVENKRRVLVAERVGQPGARRSRVQLGARQALECRGELGACRRDDEPWLAVAEDVLELACPGARVDRHDRSTGGESAEHADAGLHAGRRPDRDAARLAHAFGEARRRRGELAVAQLRVADAQRRGVIGLAEAREELHPISGFPAASAEQRGVAEGRA